jgi:hypothetical protein
LWHQRLGHPGRDTVYRDARSTQRGHHRSEVRQPRSTFVL